MRNETTVYGAVGRSLSAKVPYKMAFENALPSVSREPHQRSDNTDTKISTVPGGSVTVSAVRIKGLVVKTNLLPVAPNAPPCGESCLPSVGGHSQQHLRGRPWSQTTFFLFMDRFAQNFHRLCIFVCSFQNCKYFFPAADSCRYINESMSFVWRKLDY